MPEKSLEEEILILFDDEAQFGNGLDPRDIVNRTGATSAEVFEVLNRMIEQRIIVLCGEGDDTEFELAPRDPEEGDDPR